MHFDSNLSHPQLFVHRGNAFYYMLRYPKLLKFLSSSFFMSQLVFLTSVS